ncbi:InlB B-repeat-containing protein [Gardnerella vaginalis]|uniref:InlB B-repeat-containing protein n=1 Tax=Gardnerella vaginalis TaxID=2702 RepID=UPI0035C68A3C
MAVSKDLRGGSVKKALHKAEKANKNPNAKKAVNAKKTTSLKATAVKPARFNRGVAGVAVASTLAMMLPSAAASALQINQQNIVDSANVVSKAGKGNLRSQELNMLRWGVGARRESRQTKAFVEIARRAIEAQKQRENVENVQNTQPAISSEDFNGDKSATPTKTSEIKNTTSDSKANVTSSENTASATESANPPAGAQSSETAKVKQSEVKPVDTPAVNQPVQPTTKPESTPTAKQVTTKPAEANKPEANKTETNAGGVKPADIKPAENAQNTNAKPATGQNESAKPANAQPSSTHAENANTVSAANAPKVRKPRSAENNGGDNSGSSVPSAANVPASPAASSANNAPASTAAAPAGNTPAQSTPVTPASAESNAGAGTTASTSADTTAQDNRQKQSAESSTQGAQGSTQGSQSSAEGATTGATGKDKSATPSAPVSTPSPASTSTPNAGTQNAGSATTNNTATDPNSQVIKPNEQHPTAGSTSEANSQVQTDKKPEVTYNLQIRYTIGGAANKQLVQPYELTIDVEKLNKLDDVNSYEYIELPKSAGYRPSVYHSGDYQYYVKKGEGDKSKFVIDDGTNADVVRYLRLSKKLITDYAVKKRPAVGGNNSAQSSQNPSSTQSGSDDGIQYYGELNINYAPKTAKYYVRHLVQKLDNKDEFEEAPNIGKAIVVEHKIKGDDGNVTTTKEVIHVTEITGTVGSDVTAISTYIPGYEPEHNLISSPLSDSEDEKDKLVLNLRYYRKAYEVTYDSAGGTDVTAQKVYYDQKVPPVPEPTYRGHTFLGWQVVKPGDSSSSGPLIKGTSTNYKMPDHNVQFRAVWSANAATSYRVNVLVQKADLVDKEHLDSLANYDFVGLVERKNVQTDSEVALDKMDDAGVAKDTSKLNGESVDNYVENPELGLTREELQGTKANQYKDGLIEKFNWMNDTHVTDLEGYDTENPDDPNNYTVNAKGERVYKDKFTRYFHVNKELTKKLNREEHYLVQGRPDLGKRIKSKLCADDLNNTLNLVYDRKEYELIFASPKNSNNGMGGNNAVINKKNSKGEIISYCYAGGGDCSDKLDNESTYTYGNSFNKVTSKVDHDGYRVKVRYGQSLTDVWPNSDEVDFMDDGNTSSLGFLIGGNVSGGTYGTYRDTPPFRLTKEEFVDPKFHWMYKNGNAPQISDNPADDSAPKYTVKDNQRLLIPDSNQGITVGPIQVIIKKQSIASKKNGDTGEDIKYDLSTDSYSKDDTNNDSYVFPPSSIAGFESKITGLKPDNSNREDGVKVGESLDFDDFYGKVHELYEEVTGEDAPDDAPEEGNDDDCKLPNYDKGEDDEDGGVALKKLNAKIAEKLKTDPAYKKYYEFKKKYHLEFRRYFAGIEKKLNFGNKVKPIEFESDNIVTLEYNRQKYFVQFYNADGNAIKDGSVAATEELPFEYSLTKRGKKGLAVEDEKLYYDGGNVKSYDASVTKENADDTSKQFDGKYTFTLNGTQYSITRPDNLPKDYVFKGWALDQAGTRFINGEDKDITVPVNGIKLYAAWGKPEGIKHTVTLNYNMPETDENGKEKSGTNVVTKKQFDHYYVIKENKDIKVPTRKGYDFYGWEITKNGTTLPYAFGNKVVEDITLKAVWIEDTRYNGTFKHIFLKPGYTFTDYKNANNAVAKAAMVDHVSTQTVSGLREHLRYNAEAVYSDETHFPDKHFTSFEASKDEDQNTGEFVYQTYNTRKYKVRYVTIGEDGKEKDLLPESEVSSVNRKYDVAFYKPIEGFMPETTQDSFTYKTDEDGKQDANNIPEITFKYKDVRVLKRQNDAQARPDHYTRYVFKVADGQSTMGSVVDWQGSNVAENSALVYDAIKGTKAYQMPLPTVKAKPGFEFAGWTSQIGSYAPGSTEIKYDTGLTRLPIRSEEQNSPEVIYTANFKLKAPIAAAPQVLTPLENISTGSSDDAKKLITNAGDYPAGATFSFVPGEKFDSTPGLHKIKVQVKLGGEKPAEAEVLYRVLPDLVYASDWDKFKTSDYGSAHKGEYVKVTFTGALQQGRILGHDGETSDSKPSLVAYVYKGKKDISVRVPQAFGKEYEDDHYHYVFKGWTTSTETDPAKITNYDIKSEDRYKTDTFNKDVIYTAVYKRIDYFSSSSDGGEVPKDAVVAIFKPAPGRLWNDKTSGPKVFYVKKGTDLEKIKKDGIKALDWLNKKLTGATGKWSRSSMRNDGSDVKAIEPVTNWTVNESFQEFVAYQEPLSTPEVESNTLLAIRGDKTTLPEPKDYIANYSVFDGDNKNPNVDSVTVEYASTAPTVDKAGVYTVPLIVSVKYKDVEKPVPYKTVGKLKVMHDLIYGENVKDLGDKPTEDDQSEHDKIASEYKKVNFITNNSYGTMASGSRTLFYAHTNKTSGVRAPQAIGKDYDADGYHYEFVGWKKLASFTKDNSSAETLTTDNVKPNEILQSSSILKNAYEADTTYQAVYKRVENVIDASQQDEIPDGYVATIFLPGFGRTWADGSYKPKLLYIRHGKDKEDNIKFAQKVASDTAAKLSGFTKWQMYNARGDKSNILLHDNWDISKPRIFVAEQNGVDDVKIPETVIGVGESIPNVNKLVHNTDPKVSVSVDSSSTVDVSKPGISTIMVNVTKPIDETDSSGKQKTVTTKLPVRVYVLPKVIADNDLPAEGTAAAKFVEKNYTKVTYVAGDGGSLQKSPLDNAGEKPVSVYWVRNDATNLLMQVPDVLADNGYVFKNWTVNKSDVTDNNYATAEQREALARLAKIDGMHYVAELISDSRKSTLAVLQNLLNEAQKQHAAQVYNAKREELAKIAESKGNTDLASRIRQSNDSLQKIKNMLTQEGIDVDEIVEQLHEKALLAKIAKEAGNETLAEEISKSNDSLDDLSKKLENAGIDLAEYNKLTFDKKKEALAQFADINGLHYVASIIRASHKSSLEAFKNLIKSAKPDVKIPAYKVNEEDYASEEQRELLIQIAEEKERPDIAAKIRLLHSSTLQDLKKLFADENLYAVPAANPKKEITVTANFELMKPMRFEFRSSAVSGIPATFTLANLTENSSGNTTVKVDATDFTINNFIPEGGSNGLLPSCTGTTCKISGTPKIVDGKPKVELTFTTVDQYGRRAEIVVYIDIVDSAKPSPAPVPTPPAPEPEPQPAPQPPVVVPSAPSAPVLPFDVCECNDSESCAVPKPETKEPAKPAHSLAKTGSNVAQSAILASLLASVGLAGLAAKHRRKREDGKNN